MARVGGSFFAGFGVLCIEFFLRVGIQAALSQSRGSGLGQPVPEPVGALVGLRGRCLLRDELTVASATAGAPAAQRLVRGFGEVLEPLLGDVLLETCHVVRDISSEGDPTQCGVVRFRLGGNL